MKAKKNFLLSVVTVVVLSLQMMSPITVFADDETTPPPEETTEVTTTPDPTDVPEGASTPLPPEPTVDPVETDTPLLPEDSTEAPPESPEPTVEVIETETPLPTDQTESVEEPVTVEQTIEEPTVAEILAEIPAGTDLVILDENGEPEPLASQDAAEIIINGDPMWCPDGFLPNSTACTLGYTTVALLVTELQSTTPGYSGSGTIYFTSTYSTDDVTFDGSTLSNLTNLTIQGGWNGLTGSSYALSGNTTFNVPIVITNWNGNITVKNIMIDGVDASSQPDDAGLYIYTSQDVIIKNSTFSHNGPDDYWVGGGTGASVNANNVTISDSTFNNNSYISGYEGYGTGVSINANNVTISGSDFTGNGGIGLDGGPGNGTGASINASTVTISGSVFNRNGGDSTFDGGSGTGVSINASTVFISGSTFSNNGGIGLDGGPGNGTGASISNANSVTITNSTFSNHVGSGTGSGYGIEVNNVNTTTLNCVAFQNNQYDINVDVPNNPCNDDTNEKSKKNGVYTIPVDGKSVSFSIDCSLFSGYIAAWPNGDRVLISCVPNGKVDIEHVENTNLPDDLDAGYQYASGFNVRVFQNDALLSVMPEDGSIQVSFVAEESDAQYGIMYWDEGDWLLLEEYQLNPNGAPEQFLLKPQEFRTILSGTQFVPGNPDRENVTTNFPGTFVLVVQE